MDSLGLQAGESVALQLLVCDPLAASTDTTGSAWSILPVSGADVRMLGGCESLRK